MEGRLSIWEQRYELGLARYPAPVPYGIAESEKGYGFYGADQNVAHNLPLPGNPRHDAQARALFNEYAQPLWVAPAALKESVDLLINVAQRERLRCSDNQLVVRLNDSV